MTPLDAAHAAMEAKPGDDAARLRFYERLADGEMFLLLDEEARGDTLKPRVFALDDGPVVVIFDSEARLGGFTGIPAPYAALPGRMIALHLAGQGIGIGLNLGAPSSMLLPPEAVDWLARTLGHAPALAEALPEGFDAPRVPARLIEGLTVKLHRAGGLADHALLAGVRYRDGRRGHVLAFIGAKATAEEALARAVAEALTFSGIEAGEMDVTFLAPDAPAIRALAAVALRIDLPRPETPKEPLPRAPGMDPARPPILR